MIKIFLTTYNNNGRNWCGPNVYAPHISWAEIQLIEIRDKYPDIKIEGELIQEIYEGAEEVAQHFKSISN